MRLRPLLALLAAGCGAPPLSDPPPLQRFYFPTGIAHVAAPGTGGTLYVASSNFDRRFDFGAVTAVSPDALGLPRPEYLSPSGQPGEYPAEIVDVGELNVAESQRVLISAFAGQMAAWVRGGAARLFVPSRAEEDRLFVIDADGTTLSCEGQGDTRDCAPGALSLTEPALEAGDEGADGFVAGKPRAPEPYAVAIRPVDAANARVLVTHLQPADSPADSRGNLESFFVNLDAAAPQVTADAFQSIGASPSSGVAVGARYAYLGGRFVSGFPIPPALRLIDLDDRAALGIQTQVQSAFRIVDVRDVAVYPDPAAGGGVERRVFVATRTPDELLILDVVDPTGTSPSLVLVGSVPLPEDPNQLRIIPRPGTEGALVAITSTSANSVLLYDDDVGHAFALTGVGLQPFGLAVDAPAGARGARIFVSNFGDGRITVIDIRDVKNPADLRVVARIGASQECLTVGGAGACGEAVP